MEKMDNYFNHISNIFNHNYDDFSSLIESKYSKDEIDMINKAYYIASCYHANQYRKSGEKYIVHPISVAYFLAYYNFDYETVCAGLLHDIIEDTSYQKKELKEDFNGDILNMVLGVTKMKHNFFLNESKAVNLTHKKLLKNISKDARTIVVKLADRLNNMYTLSYLDDEKRMKIALETKSFYVNLARILGIYHIKDNLDDLCLYYLDNYNFMKYYELREKLKEENKSKNEKISNKIKSKLINDNINCLIYPKQKNVAGIYHDQSMGYNLSEISDLNAIKLLTDDEKSCYEAFNVISNLYSVNLDSIHDYIKNPKYNGYKSVNFNIENENNTQFRIRTYDMDKTNKLGMVFNWNKEKQMYLNDKCNIIFKENEKELIKKKEMKK